MNAHNSNNRLDELFADRSLGEIHATDALELDQLLAKASPADSESMDRVAALVALGGLDAGQIAEPLPEGLAAKARSAVSAALERDRSVATRAARLKATEQHVPPMRHPSRLRLRTWGAIAAVLVICAAVLELRLGTADSARARRKMINATGSDTMLVAWAATEDPYGKSASGDVVWSGAQQQGFMRFAGLPKNDPTRGQYQLWIFDTAQDERYPIDGGVFDITSDTGEAIVPIRAKLHVVRPTLFAVTVEKPGGVVVSSRKRLPLLAKPLALPAS